MAKNQKNAAGNIVYSTDPDFVFDKPEPTAAAPPPNRQTLILRYETKHRGGKQATLILGFQGSENELEVLSKKLKNMLGIGGSAKDGQIILQGDCRSRAAQILTTLGYKVKGS